MKLPFDESEELYIKLAKMIKNGRLEIKTQEKLHKTFNFNVSEFALLQQIQDKWGFQDYSQTLLYCIWLGAINNGIETL